MIIGVPWEKERLACHPDEIRAYFELLDHNVTGIPAAFSFNLDESGFQDWADRRERMVIVPATVHDDRVGIPADRSTKRSSLLLCIVADGTSLKPMLILPRKTIERELLEQGINEGISMLVYQEHGFITGDLFKKWCVEVLLPEIQQRRERCGYWGMPSSSWTVSHVMIQMSSKICASRMLASSNSFPRTRATRCSPAIWGSSGR
jgi:hypothetical protein